MRLLEEDDKLKIEVSKSEINDLEKSYKFMFSKDEEIRDLGLSIIINTLPEDRHIGVLFTDEVDDPNPIKCFYKNNTDINKIIRIGRNDWIITDENV